MVNKYQKPLKWLLEEVEKQAVEIEQLKKEVGRLDNEKAGRRGRKPDHLAKVG